MRVLAFAHFILNLLKRLGSVFAAFDFHTSSMVSNIVGFCENWRLMREFGEFGAFNLGPHLIDGYDIKNQDLR